MSTNTTGPAELRRIADALDEQSAVFSSAGWIVITNTTDVRQQAAAWDADRAEVARLTAALTEADKSAQMMADQFYEVSEGAYLIDPVEFDAHRQAIRAALRQPAPAKE